MNPVEHARVVALAALVCVAAPALASAQSGNADHSISDAVYVGGRLEPDGAWLVAYDLEILATDHNTAISLGPSLSFSFAADGGNEQGRHQEWLLACDALRARWAMLHQYGFRLSIVAGAGVWVASFYDQTTSLRQIVLADGTTVMGSEHFAGAFVPGGMITLGATADWYWDATWGLSAYLVGHVRLDQENRMPPFWLELGLGFRLGS